MPARRPYLCTLRGWECGLFCCHLATCSQPKSHLQQHTLDRCRAHSSSISAPQRQIQAARRCRGFNTPELWSPPGHCRDLPARCRRHQPGPSHHQRQHPSALRHLHLGRPHRRSSSSCRAARMCSTWWPSFKRLRLATSRHPRAWLGCRRLLRRSRGSLGCPAWT